jgi:hypothetical protein
MKRAYLGTSIPPIIETLTTNPPILIVQGDSTTLEPPSFIITTPEPFKEISIYSPKSPRNKRRENKYKGKRNKRY